jgi:hypothetical protein
VKHYQFGFILLVCIVLCLGVPAQANDLQQQSEGSMTYGETVTGRIRTSEGDSWTFEAEEGDIVTISLVGDTLYDPVLELFGPNGIRIALDDDGGIRFDSLIQFQHLDQSGTYTIVATGFGGRTGSYALTLEEATASGGGQGSEGFIEFGSTIEGRVTSEEGEFWNFFAEAGQVIQIDAIGQSLDDTVLELYGPGLEILIMDDDGGSGFNSRISGFQLPETGAYMIVVRGFDGHTGTYQLILDEFSLDLDAEGELAYGDTQVNEVTTAAGDRWTFEGSADDTISILMLGEGLEDTYLELYNPDEVMVAQDDDSGPGYSSMIRSYTLEEGGTYSIIARGYNNQVGTYSISLLEGEAGAAGGTSMEGELTYGQTVTDEVSSDFGDSWTFSGDEGDVVSIDTVGYSLEDTYLELYGPGGQLLAQDDDSGDGYSARIAGVNLPEHGTYTIVIRGYSGAAGTYELSLIQGRISQGAEVDIGYPVEQGDIELGEIVEGNVDSEDGDLWTFTGEAGTLVRVEVNGASLEDTYLQVLDPQGRLAAFDDDSGAGYSSVIEEYLVREDGVYSIIVRGYGGETGTYTLTITATGSVDLETDGTPSTEAVASATNTVCDPNNTYFVLTLDGDLSRTALQQIRIETHGSDAALAQVYPVVGAQADGIMGQALYDLTVSINNSVILTGMNTVSDMSTAILDAFDRLADSGVTVVEISYMGNQGDLKFLVWGTHAEGGGVLVSSFWGEQDQTGEMPDVPEGMAGQLIQILDPCNAR